jgi:hypothetical protein
MVLVTTRHHYSDGRLTSQCLSLLQTTVVTCVFYRLSVATVAYDLMLQYMFIVVVPQLRGHSCCRFWVCCLETCSSTYNTEFPTQHQALICIILSAHHPPYHNSLRNKSKNKRIWDRKKKRYRTAEASRKEKQKLQSWISLRTCQRMCPQHKIWNQIPKPH